MRTKSGNSAPIEQRAYTDGYYAPTYKLDVAQVQRFSGMRQGDLPAPCCEDPTDGESTQCKIRNQHCMCNFALRYSTHVMPVREQRRSAIEDGDPSEGNDEKMKYKINKAWMRYLESRI